MSMCSCLQSSLSWTKPCISANNKKCKKKTPNKYEILDFVYRINEIQKKVHAHTIEVINYSLSKSKLNSNNKAESANNDI